MDETPAVLLGCQVLRPTLPELQPQAGCSQEAPGKQRKNTRLSLLKAGSEGPRCPEENQLCPSAGLCVIQQGPPWGTQPRPGCFSPISWSLRVLFSR